MSGKHDRDTEDQDSCTKRTKRQQEHMLTVVEIGQLLAKLPTDLLKYVACFLDVVYLPLHLVTFVEKQQKLVAVHNPIVSLHEIHKLFSVRSLRHNLGDTPAVTHMKRFTQQVVYAAWFKNDRLHRLGDMPAVIRINDRIWRLDCKYEYRFCGQLHRDFGPAVIHTSCHPCSNDDNVCYYRYDWYHYDGRHRGMDLPAVIYYKKDDYVFNFRREWWVNNRRHRQNGPACVYMGKKQSYECWYLKGKKHRDHDKPAITEVDHLLNKRVRSWYHQDKVHRSHNKPAVITESWCNETSAWKIIGQEWWVHGFRHRDSGPACLNTDHLEWWTHGHRNRYHYGLGPLLKEAVEQLWWKEETNETNTEIVA